MSFPPPNQTVLTIFTITDCIVSAAGFFLISEQGTLIFDFKSFEEPVTNRLINDPGGVKG